MAGISNHLLARAILGLAVLLSAPACSVKEDRIECPVYVTVLTDEFVRMGMNEGLVSFSDERVIDREDVSFLSILRSGYRQACPREYARAAVFSGAENYILVEESMRVIPGCQAGLLWAYGESFSAQSDEYVIDATPHKQYCLVQFLFEDSPTASPDYPWRFRIKAAKITARGRFSICFCSFFSFFDTLHRRLPFCSILYDFSITGFQAGETFELTMSPFLYIICLSMPQ